MTKAKRCHHKKLFRHPPEAAGHSQASHQPLLPQEQQIGLWTYPVHKKGSDEDILHAG
jgi:hypothetical protein